MTVLVLLLLGSLVLPAHAREAQAPTITITAPTSAATYTTTTPTLTVRGTASAQAGRLARVTWQTDTDGTGTATGTRNWSFTLTLPVGTTHLTVTAWDRAGNQASDTLTITVVSPPPPGPVTIEWTYGGTEGDAFQMERCTITTACPCTTMSPIGTPAITARSWTDSSVTPTEDYAYRMAVITGGVVGPYSNTMCSP